MEDLRQNPGCQAWVGESGQPGGQRQERVASRGHRMESSDRGGGQQREALLRGVEIQGQKKPAGSMRANHRAMVGTSLVGAARAKLEEAGLGGGGGRGEGGRPAVSEGRGPGGGGPRGCWKSFIFTCLSVEKRGHIPRILGVGSGERDGRSGEGRAAEPGGGCGLGRAHRGQGSVWVQGSW